MSVSYLSAPSTVSFLALLAGLQPSSVTREPERPATSAVAPTIVEYRIPRARNFPHDPAVGPDGIVWYTDQVNSFIGRLDPATGEITDYPTPTPGSGPHGIEAGPDGMVWYTAQPHGPHRTPRSEDAPDHGVPAAT